MWCVVCSIYIIHHVNAFDNLVRLSAQKVKRYIAKIGLKKSTGVDNLSPKILRLTSSVLAGPITNIVNRMLSTNQFPDQLKLARLSPIFKKEDPLLKSNYHPVSILPAISKVFERAIYVYN